MEDITCPPKKPMRQISTDMAPACTGVKGAIHHKTLPSAEAHAPPPIRPSHVFERDRLGAILFRPNSFPQTSCSAPDPYADKNRSGRSGRKPPTLEKAKDNFAKSNEHKAVNQCDLIGRYIAANMRAPKGLRNRCQAGSSQ